MQQNNNLKFRTYRFSLDIIKFIKTLPNEKLFWTISDQLLRSATSVGANLIEAKSSSSRKDFTRYFDIALKSANETQYWLCLLKDSNLIESKDLSHLIKENEEISKMLGSSILTLKGKKDFNNLKL